MDDMNRIYADAREILEYLGPADARKIRGAVDFDELKVNSVWMRDGIVYMDVHGAGPTAASVKDLLLERLAIRGHDVSQIRIEGP